MIRLPLRKKYDDAEVVRGLQERNGVVEEWFYNTTRRYFEDRFTSVFFDESCRMEIFQTAFVKLWTEIYNGRISVRDGQVCRQQADGSYAVMTCTLQTFLMAFAKNENREVMREQARTMPMEDVGNYTDSTAVAQGTEDDADAMRKRIVDDCIGQMSPRCVEILTLFYYEGKTLEEIMEIRSDRNNSYNGLKSAKNKCMTTLRERVGNMLTHYGVSL